MTPRWRGPLAELTCVKFIHNRKKVQQLYQAVVFVWQGSPRWTLVSIGLVVIQGLLPLAGLFLLKLIIDETTKALETGGSAEAFTAILPWVILGCIVAVTGSFCRSLTTYVSEAQAQEVTDHMQEVLHKKAVAVDLSYYENPKYRDTLHRAQREAPHRPLRIVQALVAIAQSGIALAALGTWVLFTLPWTFGVVLGLAVVPGVLFRLNQARQAYTWQRVRTPIERQIDYYNWMIGSTAYAKEVRLFGLGDLFRNRASALRNKLRGQRLKIARQKGYGEFLTQAGASLAMFGSFTYLIYHTIHGSITLGALVMYYQGFHRCLSFLQELLTGLTNLYENSLFITYLYEFLAVQEDVVETRTPRPFPREISEGISFQNVSFSYTPDRPILNKINLTIPAGKIVALVGENGAGKTTLIKLLCRLYDPTEGRITVDGVDLREFRKSDLRSHITAAFQDYAHYHLTAAENIWFGDVSKEAGISPVVGAARMAGAHEIIQALPEKYDTILGNLFERGQELSIGQWQKIGLARAFFRDAPMIILDEPTSALDALSEYEVFRKFRKLVAGRTALLISHRLASVKMADLIMVLHGGTVAEMGTHQELVKSSGIYANLFETQAQHYRH